MPPAASTGCFCRSWSGTAAIQTCKRPARTCSTALSRSSLSIGLSCCDVRISVHTVATWISLTAARQNKRRLGTYYLVRFFGTLFDNELLNVQFIYKEPQVRVMPIIYEFFSRRRSLALSLNLCLKYASLDFVSHFLCPVSYVLPTSCVLDIC